MKGGAAGAASSGSSTSSWIGTLSKGMSGQLPSRSLSQSSEQLGVELTLRSCDAAAPGSYNASQPIAIRAPGQISGCLDAAKPNSGVAVQVAVDGSASLPETSIGVDVTKSGTKTCSTATLCKSTVTPQSKEQQQQQQQQQQQHLHQQPEQQSMTRVDSTALPSALTVPTALNPPVKVPAVCPTAVSDSLEAAATALVTPTPARQQQQPIPKVRWLLGDKQPHSHPQQQQQEPAARHSKLKATAAQGAAGSAAAGDVVKPPSSSSSSSSSKQVQLPLSGNAQLDRYLKYLLQEAPHKFMYYPQWGLSEQGCAAVAEFLRRDKRIKVMTLSGNSIRDDGVELIADALAANSSLLCLDLADNKIGNAGALALAEALHSNKTLTELQLSSNKIGDEGAEALAAAISSSSSLKKLQLTGNRVSAVQLQVVQHVLKTRVYKLPSRQASSSSLKGHMRKSSSLQFHIELTDSDEVLKSAARHKHQLPPATAIAALSEPLDTLEETLAAQAAQLLAELQPDAATACSADVAAADAAGGSNAEQPRGESYCCSDDLLTQMALRLAQRGYVVSLRTSCPSRPEGSEQQTSGQQESSCAMMGLRHSFIRVVQPGMETSPAIIVDPCFRAQFEIRHTSDRYASVLAALPGVLCLAESRLWHLVEALSSESKAAFRESGLSCPPWRDANTVLDKWLGRQPQDVAVDSDMSLEQLRLAVSQLSCASGQGSGAGGGRQ